MDLTILYRGPLASCDYDCPYCPFAKRRDSPQQLRTDRAALERFTAWAAAPTGDRISVLFTPWGEGLVRSWYRRALVELAQLPHIGRVAIQTNLSGRTRWLAEAGGAARDKIALWCTYHPGQTPYDRFLARCRELTGLGVRYSVGVVGLDEHLDEARRLRADLPGEVYLWVNAAEGAELHGRGGGPLDGPRPPLPVQPGSASLGRNAVPDRRVGHLGGRGRDGPPLPLRPGRAR